MNAAARQMAAPAAAPTLFVANTDGCAGARFSRTLESDAAVAARKTARSPSNGTSRRISPAKIVATPVIATTAARSFRATRRSTPVAAATNDVQSGTGAD